jgi:hypothetical protein
MIFGFLPQNVKTKAVAVAFSIAWLAAGVEAGPEDARGLLAGFRCELYRCLGKRADVLFELADAVLCKQDRVHMLAELSLEPECRRGHGAVYDALSCGQVQSGRWRACRYRPGMTAGSGWLPMSATGCGRTRPPARSGCFATVMRGAGGTRR